MDEWAERRKQLDPRYINKEDFQHGLIKPPKTWSDLVSVFTIVVTIVLGIKWFNNLESKYEQLFRDNAELKTQVSHGILPITEERIKSLESQIKQNMDEARQERIKLEEKVDRLINMINESSLRRR